jgi:hypothetical protein
MWHSRELDWKGVFVFEDRRLQRGAMEEHGKDEVAPNAGSLNADSLYCAWTRGKTCFCLFVPRVYPDISAVDFSVDSAGDVV